MGTHDAAMATSLSASIEQASKPPKCPCEFIPSKTSSTVQIIVVGI